MSEVKKLTQSIRSHSEFELCYGTIVTLNKIDNAAMRLEERLAEAQAEIERKDKLIESLREALENITELGCTGEDAVEVFWQKVGDFYSEKDTEEPINADKVYVLLHIFYAPDRSEEFCGMFLSGNGAVKVARKLDAKIPIDYYDGNKHHYGLDGEKVNHWQIREVRIRQG